MPTETTDPGMTGYRPAEEIARYLIEKAAKPNAPIAASTDYERGFVAGWQAAWNSAFFAMRRTP